MRILDKIGEPAALEQLAEECSELSQAVLKLSRIERGENPTPASATDVRRNILEEIADIEACLSALSICPWFDTAYIMNMAEIKVKRWKERLGGTEC